MIWACAYFWLFYAKQTRTEDTNKGLLRGAVCLAGAKQAMPCIVTHLSDNALTLKRSRARADVLRVRVRSCTYAGDALRQQAEERVELARKEREHEVADLINSLQVRLWLLLEMCVRLFA
jgi:hypothetical protein